MASLNSWHSKFGLALIGAAALAAGSFPAQAAITVLGKGPAVACYQAAEFGYDTAEGIKNCTVALESEALLGHDRASTYVNRGIMVAKTDPEAAIRDYDSGLRLDPNLAEAYVDRGAALLSLRRYAEALKDIDKGLSLNVSRPQIAYYDRAVAHEGLGDIRAAYEDYKKAVELSPDFALAKDQLSRFKVVNPPHGQGG